MQSPNHIQPATPGCGVDRFFSLRRTSAIALGVLIGSLIASAPVFAQPARPATSGKSVPPRKLTPAEIQAQAVLNAYTDAANFQNAAAYPLAIEAWEKFLKQYPKDPLAPKARHYLGICYLRQSTPDYESGIRLLKESLSDDRSEVREETLVNLGDALYQSGMLADGEAKKKRLEEASKVLASFLEKYADGSYADQALFRVGEAEYQLGRLDKAASFYRRLTDQPAMAKSPLRSDALFSLGVVYEEQNQPKLAAEAYEGFLKSYPEHRLLRDVKVRLAEQSLVLERPERAIELFKEVVAGPKGEMHDYILYRYGYALTKGGKFAESSEVYQELGNRYPESPYAANSFLAAGQTLMRDKQYDEAAAYFRKLLVHRNDTAAEAAHLLCQIGLMQGKGGEVEEVAREALGWAAESPRYVSLKMDLADALAMNSQKRDESNDLYERIAVEHTEHSTAPRATYNAAFAAWQGGRFSDAQRWGEHFSKHYPQDPLAPDVAYIVAESTMQLGQTAAAATAFEQLIASQPDNPSVDAWRLRLGHARYVNGEYDRVIAEMMREGLKASDKNIQAEAYFLIGASLLKQEKFGEAEESLKKSLETSPDWPQVDEAHLILAQAQIRGGRVDDAKKSLQQLMARYPQSPFRHQAEFRLGQLAATAGDYDAAIASYDRVLKGTQDKSMRELATYGKAWVLVQKEEYASALKLLQPLVGEEQQAGVAHDARLLTAVCLRNTRKAGEAAGILERMVAEPLAGMPLSKALYELGLTYIEQKKFDKASEIFDRILNDFPQLADLDNILYEYAWALKEHGKTDEAIKVFTKLSKSFAESPLAGEADFHLGQAAYDQQKFDEAAVLYNRAISRSADPSLKEKSLYKLGWTYYQQRDYEQAASQFAKQYQAFSASPLAAEALFMQGECHFKQNEFSTALDFYQQVRKVLEPNKKGVQVSQQVRELTYLHAAQAARELKKWSTVDDNLDELLKHFPETDYRPLALYEQAYSAQSQGDTAKALALYEEVAGNYTRHEIGARAQFMIGEVLFGKKDYAKAVQQFEKVIYGFGATQAPAEIKNWQARAALEAGRCSEVLIGSLSGQKKKEAARIASKFYQIMVENHPQHGQTPQAKDRLEALNKILASP